MATDFQAILDSIDAAIGGNASGVTVTEIAGRKIQKMSINELLRARGEISRLLASQTPQSMSAGIRFRKPS